MDTNLKCQTLKSRHSEDQYKKQINAWYKEGVLPRKNRRHKKLSEQSTIRHIEAFPRQIVGPALTSHDEQNTSPHGMGTQPQADKILMTNETHSQQS